MPQVVVDIAETLICCVSEQKIAPTMPDNHLDEDDRDEDDDDTGNFSSSPETPPDFPSESFYLSKEDEFEWFDRNAFYERKESTKGNSIPTPSNSNPASQRFSANTKTSKASIIGLPKTQKHLGSRANCKASNNARFFPKRSRSSAGKSPIPLTEPSSPKVSCIGRVRSKRGSRRQQRLRHSRSRKGSSLPATVRSEKTAPETEKIGIKSEHIGFWGNLKAVFSSRYRKKKKSGKKNQTEETSAEMKVMNKSDPRLSTSSEPAGMSELNRFTSGRRDELWVVGDSVDVEVVESGSVWDRRGLGPPKEVNCGRNWENVGPATA